MCFSPEADLLTGVMVSGVGIDALRRVRHRHYLPLALLPLLFGVHQSVEAFAWWGMEGRVSPPGAGEMATWLYLASAFLVVPPLVPWAVRSAEEDARRRRLPLPFVLFGVANLAAVALLGGLLARGVISLWCVWAAVTSVFIACEVRVAARQGSRAAAVAPG